MAKRVQRQDRGSVGVEVVGMVKHDGEFVEPGGRISVSADQAERLIASGHVRSIQKARGKIHNDAVSDDLDSVDSGVRDVQDE